MNFIMIGLLLSEALDRLCFRLNLYLVVTIIMSGFWQHCIDVQNVTSTCAVGVNPISRLIQIQQAKKEKEPQFSLLSENGVARSREFVFQVCLCEMSLCFSGKVYFDYLHD